MQTIQNAIRNIFSTCIYPNYVNFYDVTMCIICVLTEVHTDLSVSVSELQHNNKFHAHC